MKVRGYGGMMDLFYRTQTWKRVGTSQTKSPVGIWKTIDDTWNKEKSEVEVIEQNGELLGYIRKIYLLPHEGKDPVCLACDGKLKNEKIVGMTILSNFKQNGEKWEDGDILDPGNGKVYSASLWLVSNDELRVRGFLGPFYRTQTWKRVKTWHKQSAKQAMINSSQLQKVGAGRTATIFKYGQRQVVKLFKQTFPTKAIDEEFQIGLTLNHFEIDIPKTYEIIDLNNDKGIILEYILGSSMLNNLAKRPWMVFSYSKKMAQLHFKIHTTSISQNQSIPSLKESLSHKIARVSLLSQEEKEVILSNLSTLGNGSSICHGDFHPDNIIISNDRLVTVDWITATIGNPLADVARTWLLLTMGTLPENKTTFEIFLAKHLRDPILSWIPTRISKAFKLRLS